MVQCSTEIYTESPTRLRYF